MWRVRVVVHVRVRNFAGRRIRSGAFTGQV
jgi:hypothetical protein